MVRTQIQLTQEQADGLRRLAGERGVSIAAVIREAVDSKLGEDRREEVWDRALSVIGKYRDVDGATDVSERHDDYLAEAYEHWRRS
jgi:hypothetical protein